MGQFFHKKSKFLVINCFFGRNKGKVMRLFISLHHIHLKSITSLLNRNMKIQGASQSGAGDSYTRLSGLINSFLCYTGSAC